MMSLIRPACGSQCEWPLPGRCPPPLGRCAAARRGVYLRRWVNAELTAIPARE